MTKKLALAIISLMLVLLGTINVFAEEKQQNDIKLLTDLGIYDDSFSILDEEITRERFAVMVSRLIGTEYSYVGSMSFEDVSEEMECFEEICNLYSRKLISPSKNFRPKDIVTSSEASKILVSALGYGSMAEMRGGYPAGYQSVGLELGLYKGVNGNLLTVGDALNMILNSLDADVIYLYSAQESEDVSIVEAYRNIKCKKATITANGITSLEDFSGQSSIGDDNIMAGDEIFVDRDNKSDGFLGLEVKIWYNQDTMEVVSIIPVRDYKYKRIIPSEIESVEDAYTIICDNGKRETIKLDRNNVKVMFNGTYYPLYSEIDLNIENGYIEMYDSNNDKYYDIVYIWSPKVYVVDKATKERLYFKYDDTFQGNPYIMKTDNIDIYLDGKLAEMSEFIEWDIINVYEMKNSEKVKVESEYKPVSGKLTGMTDEYVSIDGTEYEINPNGHFSKTYYEVGKDIDVYLDLSNRVYLGVKVNNGDEEFLTGYITRVFYDEEDERSYVEFFTSGEEFAKYGVADKIKIYSSGKQNGYNIKEQETVKEYLSNLGENGTCYQLVKYTLNNENRIDAIYCAIPIEEIKEEAEYPLKLEYDKGPDDPYAHKYVYGGILFFKHKVDWGPTFWMIPENRDERDFYKIKPAASAGISSNGHAFNSIKLYNCDINGRPEIAVTIDAAVSTDDFESSAPTGIVKEVTHEMFDDSPARALTVYYNGNLKKIYVTEEFESEWVAEEAFYKGMEISDIKPGDMIHFSIDEKNEVKVLRVLLRENSKGQYRLQNLKGDETGKLREEPGLTIHLVYGEVVKNYDGARVDVKVNGLQFGYVFMWQGAYINNYTVIDRKNNKVSIEKGTVNDIAVGDEIAFRWAFNGVDDVFIYKKAQ